MSGVTVLEPGLFTTVQDAGRWGYQSEGIRVQGVMDPVSYRFANLLVGNDPGAAVLEATLIGPRIRLEQDLVLAVTGADLTPTLNGHPIPMWQGVYAYAGSELAFGAIRSGCRAYLAFSGGVDTPVVLGSRSTCVLGRMGGLNGGPLQRSDWLPVGEPPSPLLDLQGLQVDPAVRPVWASAVRLRVVLGPQADAFPDESIRTFLASAYRLSHKADRMGVHLDGPSLTHIRGADIISEAIPWGAIQIPANGRPIILLAGRQGVGGYAKIATVITADLPLIAQAKPGDEIRFDEVDLAEAQAALAEQRRRLSRYSLRAVPVTDKTAYPELVRHCYHLGFVSMTVRAESFHFSVRTKERTDCADAD